MQFKSTPEQTLLLKHDPSQHARVLAGPGTGKSTTMVALLNSLLEKDSSLRVRMLTFTRAATAELAEKVASHPHTTERPSTIHSFSISVLLLNPGTGEFPEPLRIADTWEFKTIVRSTLAKRTGVTVRILDKLINEMASNWESLTDEIDPEISEEDRIRFKGAWNEHRIVFGYILLQELPYALRRALDNHDDLDGIHFDLLLVDEYQDLNACDLEVLKLLSKKGGCNIVGTGDDDQSIYAWRKAEPEGIRRFLTDYSSACDYSLSVSLRCGKKIIEWANSVIQRDPDRPKERAVLKAQPDAPDGEVALLRFAGHRAEAKGIAKLVKALSEKNIALKDILILMRTDHNGTFSKAIREELDKLKIPYSDPSSIYTLLEQSDNRRLLELVRLLLNPNDSIAWASLLSLTNGVGETFFDYIYERAKKRGATFAAELLSSYQNDFPDGPRTAGKAKKEMETVLQWIDENAVPDKQPENGWGSWIPEFASQSSFVPTPTDEFRNLLLKLDELAEKERPLGRYLGQIEPLGKDLAQAHSEGVRIMTMGGSKGLTVRATIIAGVENNIIPRPNSDPSEELRILYVALTRAKEYVLCTWAKNRRGPTARAGKSSMNRRNLTSFLSDGPVKSEDGETFITRFQKAT